MIRFFLENKLVAYLLLLLLIGWGMATAPFDWELGVFPRDPVSVDAIPDIGENQQIVFTEWPGRSPQDIQDQITYPLTTALLGVPGVKSVRSNSMFGFSSIYLIFEENIEFYWSRARILEKLNALPAGLLPDGVQPALGPDATALGQIYWYTLEGRDPDGNVTGGWDLQELRSIQDFYVKYGLMASEGVAEVASIGGFVKEYQVDVDPLAMKEFGLTLREVVRSVQDANLDVGARTVEVNRVEYLVRGLGYIRSLEDLEESVVTVHNNTPIRIKDIAVVQLGPAERRGILDKGGAEVVGGVVVARHGANPMEVIQNVKRQMELLSPGLPEKTLRDGTTSKLTIVPFYDRTELIRETLGTLYEALSLQILVTILVIMIMVINLRASLLISGLLPVAVLMCFIAMRYFGVEANIVALSGIAIAIGTLVDMGIILSENMLRHLEAADPKESRLEVIHRATKEVAGAVVTALTTTVISFLPVFTLQAAEGKLFRPLAYTKTFALIAAIIVAIVIIPPLAHSLFSIRLNQRRIRYGWYGTLFIAGIVLVCYGFWWAGLVLIAFGLFNLSAPYLPGSLQVYRPYGNITIALLTITWLLAYQWLPLGPESALTVNYLFIILFLGLLLSGTMLVIRYYRHLLHWALNNKPTFLLLPTGFLFYGALCWFGFSGLFGFVAKGFDTVNLNIRTTKVWSSLHHTFPPMEKEFMPALDEGAFLLMPTTMPHAGIEESKEALQQLDMAVAAIPEVKEVVGKLGRVESALDPAPVSMFENLINYKTEYKTDASGNRLRFAVDKEGNYRRDEDGRLIPDPDGQYYRQWRDHIQNPDDIWQAIVTASKLPGLTSAPKLQPIETRLIMLQSGMRAPMGVKVTGPDLPTIEAFGMELEHILREVPGVNAPTVYADRIVGKPYLNIRLDRHAMGRYGLKVADVQRYIETGLGGATLTTTVEGRERYPVRVRYARDYRQDPEAIGRILIPTATGTQVPLQQLADIEYARGPQSIKSENTFPVGYVTFDKTAGHGEVNVVNGAREAIQRHIEEGKLKVPQGVSYTFAGNYQNQVRAEKRLAVVMPLSLLLIFLVLYFQFRSIPTTVMVFSGIIVAFAGGFILLWAYGQPSFLDFHVFGTHMRDLFQIKPYNLSVAVWVGFIALFGIAVDDGVLMATYLQQSFARHRPRSVSAVRQAVLDAGLKRIRPCMMTTATTLLALLPILTSTGRGADIMVPMAIPAFGGMLLQVMTVFVVPVLYAWWQERVHTKRNP